MYMCFAIAFVHVLYKYAYAHLEYHPPWREQRLLYIYVSIYENANACHRWHAYWRDVVIKMSFHTCCLLIMTPSTLVVVKTMKKIIISHHIWCFKNNAWTYNVTNFNIHVKHVVPHNILPFHVISTKPTIAIVFPQNVMFTSFLYWVHASFHTKCNVHVICLWGPRVNPHKIQYPRKFLMGSKCRPRQRRIPRESGLPGTANTSFIYMGLTCPPCVRLWGPWKTMSHVMSHKNRAQIGHVLSVFIIFLVHQL